VLMGEYSWEHQSWRKATTNRPSYQLYHNEPTNDVHGFIKDE
jgi:hypothetical protein